MKAYIDEGHARGLKVKIYYTVRELSNRAPELFALRSLGDEILSKGPGGGFSWLQEHLGSDYIAAWFVPELKDAAVINTGVSRWHNYYVEGLAWLAKNVGIDGLYIDDVAFDRTTMKRVRKVLDLGRPGALIDLHSANQYNPRDGFASSANLYLEHFPFLNRLWFGEYFDYNSGARLLARGDLGHPVRPDGRDAAGQRQPLARDGLRHDRPAAVGRRPAAPVEGLGRFRHFRERDDRLVGRRESGQNGESRCAGDEFAARQLHAHRPGLGQRAGRCPAGAIDWKKLGLGPQKAVLHAPAIGKFRRRGIQARRPELASNPAKAGFSASAKSGTQHKPKPPP